MRIVVGLGNPGAKYDGTRHNVGFRVVDRFIDRRDGAEARIESASLRSVVGFAGGEVLVVKPLTFMNRSGQAVGELLEMLDSGGENLIVCHDDLDLPVGTVRVRVGGGHGGHNGLRSILDDSDPGEFTRVRIGIAREPGNEVDAAAWVLARFPEEQDEIVNEMIKRATDAVETILVDGAAAAMNEFNRRKPREDPDADDLDTKQSDRN